MKVDYKLISAGVLTAIASSLCCITPVLALIAGTGGVASTFSWLEPLRPYLIGLTVLVLSFAWYQKLKAKKKVDCHCEIEEKPKFFQTKIFLGIVTVFSVIMLAFPYYSGVFYFNTEKQYSSNIGISKINKVEFSIKGMTCNSCEEHVNYEINKLSGIIKSDVSYNKGNAIIEFDASQTNISKIENAIRATGYSVTGKKEL